MAKKQTAPDFSNVMLRACPFCGRSDRLGLRKVDGTPAVFTILCGDCLAEGPEAENPQAADDSWNSRASD
jgi:Lar family restriction alleviation protein